eukprot:gene8221-11140_t
MKKPPSRTLLATVLLGMAVCVPAVSWSQAAPPGLPADAMAQYGGRWSTDCALECSRAAQSMALAPFCSGCGTARPMPSTPEVALDLQRSVPYDTFDPNDSTQKLLFVDP